jgi:gliding motility-associated-like protein
LGAFKRHIVLSALLFTLISTILAQREPPKHPRIVQVSVDTSSGLVSIRWEASTSPDVVKYTMFYDSTDVLGQTSWFPTYDTVGADTREHTYSEVVADRYPRSLTVQAIDSFGNSSNFNDWHTTMYLETTYDSCTKQMQLEWNAYRGWGNDLVRYDVFYRLDDGPFQPVLQGGTLDTAIIQIGILDNRQYCYLVRAIHPDPGTESFSNIACRYIDQPNPPAWINAESASVIGSDQIELKFAIDPAGEVGDFQLYKAAGPDRPFVPDIVFRQVGDTLVYVDPVPSTEKRRLYKLYSLDVCDHPVTESNIAGNVVLTVTSQGLMTYLHWNPYIEYEADVERYQVYRIINRSDPQPIAAVIHPDTLYEDDLSGFNPGEIEDEICYHVEAIENAGWTQGGRGASRSNQACVSVVPEIIMANAITPNDDGMNDCIKPALTFIPKKYLFVIYDRWGSKIFEASQYSNPEYNPCQYAWDGRINGGRKVPEGVYVYYIRLTTFRGIEVEKKGEITVFYP